MKITIIGAGAFGSALGHLLEVNGHSVIYYNPESPFTLAEAQTDADFNLLSVPSKALPDVLPDVEKNIPLIVATKGILDPTIFHEFKDWMILSGPGFAKDIEQHLRTELTVTDRRIQELFKNTAIEFDYTVDKTGVFLCGALKNIYAIYAGYKNYLPSTKKHQKYLKDASNEMRKILEANNATPETVDCACGIGDLKLTCDFPSRNFMFGQKFAKNQFYQPEETVEGVTALHAVKTGTIKLPKNLKIMQELFKISDNWA